MIGNLKREAEFLLIAAQKDVMRINDMKEVKANNAQKNS